jgi:hypothetical protein
VKEATDKELAILAEKPTGRKGKKNDISASGTSDKDDITRLERRLDVYEAFMKVWEPKLQKWDSFIEELHEAQLASNDDGGKTELLTKTERKTPP